MQGENYVCNKFAKAAITIVQQLNDFNNRNGFCKSSGAKDSRS